MLRPQKCFYVFRVYAQHRLGWLCAGCNFEESKAVEYIYISSDEVVEKWLLSRSRKTIATRAQVDYILWIRVIKCNILTTHPLLLLLPYSHSPVVGLTTFRIAFEHRPYASKCQSQNQYGGEQLWCSARLACTNTGNMSNRSAARCTPRELGEWLMSNVRLGRECVCVNMLCLNVDCVWWSGKHCPSRVSSIEWTKWGMGIIFGMWAGEKLRTFMNGLALADLVGTWFRVGIWTW